MTKLLPTIPKAVKNKLSAGNQTVASMIFAALKVSKRLLAFFNVRATLAPLVRAKTKNDKNKNSKASTVETVLTHVNKTADNLFRTSRYFVLLPSRTDYIPSDVYGYNKRFQLPEILQLKYGTVKWTRTFFKVKMSRSQLVLDYLISSNDSICRLAF